MQRRKLIQYSTLAGLSYSLSQGLSNPPTSLAQPITGQLEKTRFDWIILYWMPYDNNLSELGKLIIEKLSAGVQSDNVLVVVESDLLGKTHLSRHLISKGNIHSQKIPASDSSSTEVFAEYLNWAKSEFLADKWAIAILGHGGRLDEISPDLHPYPNWTGDMKWMNIQELSHVVEQFSREIGDRIELFFCQNCNKSTLEVLYTLHKTAKYSLASQLTLGAPNDYYQATLDFLGHHSDINGGELAQKIIEFEASDMYFSYTVIDNSAMRDLPKYLNPLISSILANDIQAVQVENLPFYYYMGDRLVDMKLFFQTAVQQSGANPEILDNFVEFIQKSLIYRFDNRGKLSTKNRNDVNYSGVGMLLPSSQSDLLKYNKFQALHDLQLFQLFHKILPS